MKEVKPEIIIYQGNCPRCNKVQQKNNKDFVNMMCRECAIVLKDEQLEEECKYLIGGVITEIVFENENITIIKMEKDGRIYSISSEGSDEGTYLTIDEK